MTLVAVGSKNPIKLQAVKRAFYAFQCQHPNAFLDELTIMSVHTSNGGMPAMPMNEAEILHGAIHRAEQSSLHEGTTLGVGAEGGIFLIGENWFCNSWVAIHRRGSTWIGQGPGVMVPRPIMGMILQQGMELGDAEDIYFGNVNTKQGIGLTGTISQGMITRSESFSLAAVCALGAMKCGL